VNAERRQKGLFVLLVIGLIFLGASLILAALNPERLSPWLNVTTWSFIVLGAWWQRRHDARAS
jgi:hypothetical protein